MIKRLFCFSLCILLGLDLISCHDDDAVKNEPKQKLFIATWGDSLTAGAGGEGTTYPSILQSLLGSDFQVINCGVGGENSITIAARQGGIPMILTKSIELPADNSIVIIEERFPWISSWNGSFVYPLLQGGESTINNCIIDDVECIIGWTGTAWNDPNGRYSIQRANAGNAPVTLREKSIVYTSSMKQYIDMFANVFFIGQNLGYANNADLVAQYKAMIGFSKCKNYVILGLTSGTKAERASLEELMTREFGVNYINLREYLSTKGLSVAGLTPTQADMEAMKEGKVPPSLLSGSVHFNAKGYELIGNVIYNHLRYLGII
ncbi:MAG: hypothetical protein LBH32_00730 [Dysgonamonadaceae bacterium]|jgi:hypothetical protein|nr:hypothetical protein [Dysgonamonadaceae bacterium]